MEPNNIFLAIIFATPYILIILSLIAYIFLILGGKFEERRSRIDSSYLFEVSGILLVIYYVIFLGINLVLDIITPIINSANFNTGLLNIFSFGINGLLDFLFVGASILLIIIGAKNTQYFYLIITGSLYLLTIIISYIFSFSLDLILQTQGIGDFNFILLYDWIESITIGTIILAAEISFLVFSIKYERELDPIKNKFKTTGILLVIGAVSWLIYSTIYLGLRFFSL